MKQSGIWAAAQRGASLSRASAGRKGKKAVRLTGSENLAERPMQQQAAQICQGEEASVVCKGHT